MTLRLAMLGPPASGKGTQASRLAERHDVPHLSTGDLLREAIAAATELGERARPFLERGELVPDDLVLEILSTRLDPTAGFVLDGFPRTVGQFEALEVPLELAVKLEIPQEESIRRITGRRVCPDGHVFHVDYDPPEEPGVCDLDGEPLHQREDDREEIVRTRWREYERLTEPLLVRLDGEGLLVRVDGTGDPDTVEQRVRRALDQG